MSKHMADSQRSQNSESITFNKDKPIQHSTKDAASLGAEAIATSNWSLAISHYTKAISTHPQAVDYYIKRSTAYTRGSPSNPTSALEDAETAVVLAHNRGKRELIAQAQLRRGISLYSLRRYGDARKCFEWVKKLAPKEKSLTIWEAKVEEKLHASDPGSSNTNITITEIPDIDISKLGKEAKTSSPAVGTNNQIPLSTSASTSSTQIPKAPTATPKPEGVQTPANKIRHDWYQSTDSVTITLLAKGVPKDSAIIDIQATSLSITFPLPTGADYDFSLEPLFAAIDPAASTHKIMSTKVEFILKKAVPGQKWKTLEGVSSEEAAKTQPSTNGGADDPVKRAVLTATNPTGPPISQAPSYPTSSRTGPKNWDKLADDLTKKKDTTAKKSTASAPEDDAEDDADAVADENYDEDDDGGDPANAFFKKIFKDADPDTKRAMMKSYQESNGTALSTNWAEVGKGKVETSPPDGMVARKWGE